MSAETHPGEAWAERMAAQRGLRERAEALEAEARKLERAGRQGCFSHTDLLERAKRLHREAMGAA